MGDVAVASAAGEWYLREEVEMVEDVEDSPVMNELRAC